MNFRIIRKYSIAFIMAAMVLVGGFAQEAANPEAGKTLFKANCAQCHNRNMKDDLTGPALGLTEQNWEAFPREDLYEWIRNSQAMVESGHPRARQLWSEWGPTVMNPFPDLTDQQLEDLLAYISGVYTGTYGAAAAADGSGAVVQTDVKANSKWLYWVVVVVLAILALIFTKLLLDLKAVEAAKDGKEAPTQTLMQLLTSKKVVSFLIFGLVLIGGYFTVNNAIALNRQQNYQPDQPIKFSHVTHAGVNQIECQYCHDGARRSKHSIIPATNTCMNCHSAIKVGSKYGTQEITKIYASIGYDPVNDIYLDNYEDMPQDEVAEVYKNWFKTQFMKDEGIEQLILSADKKKANAIADEQWENIVSSLTNSTKTKVQGPIEWTRIHNLPDHVYFNHSQHVGVGKLECQQCHGPIEEMEVVKQYAPLSMGWCVNCHRQTDISSNMLENPYYQKHYHDLIEKHQSASDPLTVEDIGGLECQKCHY